MQKLIKITSPTNKNILLEGNKVPCILLPSTSGKIIDLSLEAKTSHLVIFVYPGDREGFRYPELIGCTPQACSFNTKIAKFQKKNTKIFGLSMQSTLRQQEFMRREHLDFALLSDTKKKFVNAFGISLWQSHTKEEFPERTTIIIQQGGQIAHILRDIQLKNHAQQVLEIIEKESDSLSNSCLAYFAKNIPEHEEAR